ncbi:hypothetical protein BFP70_07095 [Thioclava sp. SK-1]|uniref:hypothetical protein n=1 Tax=Thioclava sp. SK-1 TaxID=1889770 RepID=UPI0008242DA0|nr:hypothetical protein [Thioclava sp. SK-1]OCX65893.1 hypothetical protein BFP70_07095 [Thioclava sp. SK-1]
MSHPKDCLIVSLILSLAALSSSLIAAHDLHELFAEGQGVELVTVVLFGFALVVWARTSPDRVQGWHIATILALMAMREMDFDKRFTSNGVLQLRLYTADGPLIEKIIGLIVIAVILAAVWRLIRRDVAPWLFGLRAGRLQAWLMVAAFGLLVFAKAIDGIGRKLAPFGVEFSPLFESRAARIEELCEMLFAILIVQIIALAYQGRRRWQANHNDTLAMVPAFHPMVGQRN